MEKVIRLYKIHRNHTLKNNVKNVKTDHHKANRNRGVAVRRHYSSPLFFLLQNQKYIGNDDNRS